MANAITLKIRGVADWIKKNPQVVEPNMYECMELVSLASRLKGKARDEALEAFSDMYAARFGNPKCPDRSKSAMWALFRKVCNAIIMEGYCVEDAERELLSKLEGVGNYCLQSRKYSNFEEFEKLQQDKEKYISLGSAKFTSEVEAAFQEIASFYYKK